MICQYYRAPPLKFGQLAVYQAMASGEHSFFFDPPTVGMQSIYSDDGHTNDTFGEVVCFLTISIFSRIYLNSSSVAESTFGPTNLTEPIEVFGD